MGDQSQLLLDDSCDSLFLEALCILQCLRRLLAHTHRQGWLYLNHPKNRVGDSLYPLLPNSLEAYQNTDEINFVVVLLQPSLEK